MKFCKQLRSHFFRRLSFIFQLNKCDHFGTFVQSIQTVICETVFRTQGFDKILLDGWTGQAETITEIENDWGQLPGTF